MNKIIMIMFVLFTLVSCNSRQTDKDTTGFCSDCPEEVGSGYDGSATIEISDTIPEEYYYTDWMRVYSKYIIDNIDTSVYQRFSICYIDNNPVPELCLFGSCFGDGAVVLTQQNEVLSSHLTYWYPYYIEKTGLIDNSVAHSGTYGDEIVQLTNGSFKVILRTKAIWNGEEGAKSGFTYYINDKMVESLSGSNIDETSCTRINDAIHQAYKSKGRSCAIYESPQGVYSISGLYAKNNR